MYCSAHCLCTDTCTARHIHNEAQRGMKLLLWNFSRCDSLCLANPVGLDCAAFVRQMLSPMFTVQRQHIHTTKQTFNILEQWQCLRCAGLAPLQGAMQYKGPLQQTPGMLDGLFCCRGPCQRIYQSQTPQAIRKAHCSSACSTTMTPASDGSPASCWASASCSRPCRMVGLRRMSSRSCWRCRSWMAARATAVAWAAGRLLRRAKPAGSRWRLVGS